MRRWDMSERYHVPARRFGVLRLRGICRVPGVAGGVLS